MSREFTVIVWGASGFVGKLVSKYLAQNYGSSDSSVSFALAGRSMKKLEEVRDMMASFNPRCKNVTLIASDNNDLGAVAKRARAVIALVGPYAALGEPMLKACVQEGTNYVDLTGEIHWGRRMQEKYHEEAKRKGLKIVSFCGFDSIPFDISTYMLQLAAKKSFGQPGYAVENLVTAMRGGFSGGTIHSGMLVYEEERKELLSVRDPNFLCPKGSHSQLVAPDAPYFNEDLKMYSARFFMTPVNSKVVRKSAATFPELYVPAKEKTITYREGLGVSNVVLYHLINFFTMAVAVVLFFAPPLRTMIKWLIPAGTGPSESVMRNGYFTVNGITHVRDENNKERRLMSTFSAKGDPGYQESAKMVTEAGIAAALLGSKLETSHSKIPLVNGLGTPATCLGEDLVERLRSAGMDLKVVVLDN